MAAGAGLRSGAAGELLASAWRLRWGAPELSLIFAERAAQLAESDAAARLAADAMVVHAKDHLAQGVRMTVRGVDALRGAEQLGADEIGWRLRIDLAATARVVGAPLIGFALLRPVLTADVPQEIRADGLLRLVDCLAHLGPAPELDRAAWEADRIYATDPSADQDTVALHRARLAVVVASAYRRWGDRPAAERQARAGLEFLAALRDPGADSGRIGVMLTSELVLTLLDADRPGPAAEVADPVLAEPARAPTAADAGWLRVVLATRVHLPAGRHQLATDLLREAAELGERHDQAAVQAAGLLALAQAQEAAGEVVEALECLHAGFAAERRWQWAVHAARVCFAEAFPGANRQSSDWRAELAALVAGVSGSDHSGIRPRDPAPASTPVAEPTPVVPAPTEMPTPVAEPLLAGSSIPDPELTVPAPDTPEHARVDPLTARPQVNPFDPSTPPDGVVSGTHRADPYTFDHGDAVISAPSPAGTADGFSAEDTHPNLTPVTAPAGAFIDDHPTEPIPVIRDLADGPIGELTPHFLAATGRNVSPPSSDAQRLHLAGQQPLNHDDDPDHRDHSDRPGSDKLMSRGADPYAENSATDPRNPGGDFDFAGRSDVVHPGLSDGFAHVEGPYSERPERVGADAITGAAADWSADEPPSAWSGEADGVEASEQFDGSTHRSRRAAESAAETDAGRGRHRGTVAESARDALAEAVALAATRPSRRRRSAEPTEDVAEDSVNEPGPSDTAPNEPTAEPTTPVHPELDGFALQGQGTSESRPSAMDTGWRQGSADYDAAGDWDVSPEPFEDDHGEPAEKSRTIAPMIADEVDAAISLSHASARLDPAIRDAWLAAGAEPRGLIMFPPGARFPDDEPPHADLTESAAPTPADRTPHREPTPPLDPSASPRLANAAPAQPPTPPPSPTAPRRRRSRTARDHAEHAVHLPLTTPSAAPSAAPNPPSPATGPEPTAQPESITDNPAASTHRTDATPADVPAPAHEAEPTPVLAAPQATAELQQPELPHPDKSYSETSNLPRAAGPALSGPTGPAEPGALPDTAAKQADTQAHTGKQASTSPAVESAQPHPVATESEPARTAAGSRYRIPRPSEHTTEPQPNTDSNSATDAAAAADQVASATLGTIQEPNPETAPANEPNRAVLTDTAALGQPDPELADQAADPATPDAAAAAEPAPAASVPTDVATAAPSHNGTAPEPDRRPGTTRRSRRNGARKSFTDDGPGIADLLTEALIAYETGRRSASTKSTASHRDHSSTPTPATPHPAAAAHPSTPYQAAAALDQHPNRITEPVGKVNSWPEPAASLNTVTAAYPTHDATTDPATDPLPAQLTAAVAPPLAGLQPSQPAQPTAGIQPSQGIQTTAGTQPSAGFQASTGIQTVAAPRPDGVHDTYAAPWTDTRRRTDPGPEHQSDRQPSGVTQSAHHSDHGRADDPSGNSVTAEPHTGQRNPGPHPDTTPPAKPGTASAPGAASLQDPDPTPRRSRRKPESEPDLPKRSYRIPHRLPSEHNGELDVEHSGGYDEPSPGRHGARIPDAQPDFVVDVDGADPAVIGPPRATRETGSARYAADAEPDHQVDAEPRSAGRTLDESRMLDLPADQVWTPPSKRTW